MSVDEYIAALSHPEWLVSAPLGAVAGQYIDDLQSQRYSRLPIRLYLNAVAHFSYWATTEALGISAINEAAIARFLFVHLPTCACSKPCLHGRHESRAALSRLLIVLRAEGLVEQKTSISTPFSEELLQFRHYLADVCGLGTSTCAYRLRAVRLFLDTHFVAGCIDMGRISPQHVDDWIIECTKRYRSSSIGVLRSSLRSYFRYRALCGDSTEQLSAALPALPCWGEAKLITAMSDDELRRFLGSFDLTRPTGLRDCAMAHCLIDLGLRGHEVAQLALSDVDWRAGTLSIRKTKGKRVRILPLPVATGAAVAEYLRKGRPKTSNRQLFVRHVAPFETPLGRHAAANAMNRAFVRGGLDAQFSGTHVLRRTLATRLQRSGSSLKAIADLLGHRDLQTTTRYAKVDFDRMREIALPWPGRQS